jgi:hypothetical protein
VNNIIILQSIKSTIKQLKIACKGITGILDLLRFTCLEGLYCSANDIINILPTVKKIACNYNNNKYIQIIYQIV